MRTRLSSWQMPTVVSDGDSMKYSEIKYTTPAHVGNSEVTYKIPLPEGQAGILIHTLRVSAQTNVAFVVSLMDGNSSNVIYESNQEIRFHYDQVIIPYKPVDGFLYLKVYNKGDIASKFDITIRGVEVK